MTEILSVLNENPKHLDGPDLLHKLINWEAYQSSCALDFLSENGSRHRYTYAELRSNVDVLSAELQFRLRERSSEKQSQPIIPILLPQSPALYISILAVLQAGAAYCPITLDSPTDRIRFVVDDVSADILITIPALTGSVTWKDGPDLVIIEEIPRAATDASKHAQIIHDVLPKDLAYIMYTSGSTGKPKGVALSHLAVTQSLLAHDKHIPQFKRFLQFAAPSFDVSQFEILFPLFRGATLVGCHRPRLLNNLTAVINELEVDAAELTPTVAGALLQKRSHVPKLKTLLTIGEMLTRPVVDEFGGSESRDSMLFGMYGPTEAAIHCTVNPQMQAGSKVANIGIPFDTVSTFILSIENSDMTRTSASSSRILPRGEIGELVLGGPQLASGYLNRPEQNATAFIIVNNLPAYRTGDKARILEDGTLEILGRISSGQVKIRGQRAELGEIEEAVYKTQNIKMAVASVLDGSLVVFALEREPGTNVRDIIETCSKWLPNFMVPNEIILADAFPYLPSGKVDKRKLEDDYRRKREEELDHDEDSQTPTEQHISNLLDESVDIRARATDRLAAYGLDSLRSITIASFLRSSGYQVSSLDVLQAGTLRDLARICENQQTSQNSVSSDPLDFSEMRREVQKAISDLQWQNIDTTYPCTSLQDAMLSETQVNPTAYQNEIRISLASSITESDANRAIHSLAKQNAILRTGFIHCPNSYSSFAQIVWKSLSNDQIQKPRDIKNSTVDSTSTSLLYPFNVYIQHDGESLELLVHIHHALYDGWALELLLDDLDDLLSSRSPPDRPAFQEFVESDLKGSQSLALGLKKEYWKDHLAYFEPRSLPNFHPVKNVSGGLKVINKTSRISTAKLEAVAREHLVSPQAVFQAAYSIALSAYLGKKDIAFGTVFSGRTANLDGVEDIVGPCLATLPVRVDLDTAANLEEVVQQLHSINRKHLENLNLSLREIKRAATTDQSHPLFDTLIVWQQTLHGKAQDRSNVKLLSSRDFLEFNLTLEVDPSKDTVALVANFQTSIFPDEQIHLLLSQIESITIGLMEFSDKGSNDLKAFMSEDLLSIDNPAPHVSITTSTLSSSVEAAAFSTPDKPAIAVASSIENEKATTQTLTYAELNSNANQIAHYLASIGAGPDELVCICLEKSILLYTTILATVKTGAGYLPVTPDTPPERIRNILPDAKVGIVVTHSMVGALFNHLHNVKVVYIDELECEEYPEINLPVRSNPQNLAYCIFTSGSTGMPKGVLVNQGNLLSNLEVLADLYPHTESSRLLQSCSQAFDVSVFEIFFTWHIGGCICTASKDVLFRDIEMSIRALNVTHLSLTPTVAALINPDNTPKVEFLVTAGEAVTQKVFNMWADRGLYQGYGPSETTNICTVLPKVTHYHPINNIGKGFRNTSTFVLAPGQDFRVVPRGGEGEFCFGGAQVGRGYLDYKQSVGKFIEHPQHGRLYRSGDFGRMLSDGSLSFTGRQDDQVKVRGFRIELGEINSTILGIKEVKDCVTIVIEKDASQRLVAFWTPSNISSTKFICLSSKEYAMETKKIFSALISSLPFYMIPSSLVPVSMLPATTQAKIDKRKLVQEFLSLDITYLDEISQTHQQDLDHTWTDTERAIVDALARTANVAKTNIAPNTSFFSLGIDSISAITLARLLEELKIRVTISDILKRSSVIRLAEVVTTPTVALNDADIVKHENPDFGLDAEFVSASMDSFEKAGLRVESVLPCTPLQEAMLSASEKSSHEAYCNHVLLKLSDSKTQEKFERAWLSMIQRHEILRTCFISTDMSRFAFAQVVLENPTFSFNAVDVANLRIVKDIKSQPIDPLQKSPPYRISTIRIRNQSYILISMHHALHDGFATSVLFDEIEESMRGTQLPDTVSFTPFLRKMHLLELEKADNFWQNMFENFQTSPLQQRNSNSTEPYVQQLTSTSNAGWINSQIKTYDTSLLSVCHTVWASVIGALVNSDDVCFGNVVSGRTVQIPGIDRLVAPCFNTIPVRAQKLSRLSFLESFRALQSQNIESLPFQLTPLRRIQSKNSTDGRPLFETLLILQPPSKPLDAKLWRLIEEEGAMDVPIVLEITPRSIENDFVFTLHSSPTYLSKDQAMTMLQNFDQTLTKALTNPRHQTLTSEVKAAIDTKEAKWRKTSRQAVDDTGTDSLVSNDLELEIQKIFAQFSTVPENKIRKTSSIFRLGLDSINAVQIAAALRKLDHQLVASDVLQNPTSQRLAEFLNAPKKDSEVTTLTFDFEAFDNQHRQEICAKLGVAVDEVEAVRPCTMVQSGMLAQTMHSSGTEYINSLCMELKPGSSLEQFRTAWEVVTRRHVMLRTAFVGIQDAKHPFAMVTFPAKGGDILPWFDAQESGVNTPLARKAPDFSNYLEQWPWKLELLRDPHDDDDDAKTVRFTAHHALYDAQSLELLLSEVVQAYHSPEKLTTEICPIDPLISAIVLSGEQDVQGDASKFWQVENKIFVNKFPDLTPLHETSAESLVYSKMCSLSVAQLESLCQLNEVSAQAVGQAAWAKILSIYTGEAATTFGITLSGRSILEGAEKVAFPSIVTLPIAMDASGTNEQLLEQSMHLITQIHEYQYTPLSLIQKLSEHPEGKMFDTLFAYQKTTSIRNHAAPWTITDERASADFVVSIELEPHSDGKLEIRLTAKKSVVPSQQALLLLRQFNEILVDLLRSNDEIEPEESPPSEVELLSITPAAEPTLPSEITLLHDFVSRQTALTPGKVALEFVTGLEPFESKTWTYFELNAKGNRVARLIQEIGIEQGELVGICFDKCPEASFAMLGILKAGCAYVALDPNAPADRVKFILDDSKSKLVFSAGSPARNLISSEVLKNVNVLDLSREDCLDEYSAKDISLIRSIDPQDTSYCLYTSGTTGTPKGCLLSHENAVQAMLSFQHLFADHWTPESRWLTVASWHFDVSVLEQYWSWSVGIRVVCAPRDLIFEDIPTAINKMQITHIDLTPSLARLVHPDDVPGLWDGVFITGGEQLKQEILDVWGEKGTIYNGYGPTEATIGCTMYTRVPANGKPANIGPAFLNVGSYILKPGTNQPVHRGGIGELCVSGKLVGKGYLNRDELTKERFPYLKEFGERVYRTGDLVRILHNGTFLFLGRADDQVKLRGQRIQLSEGNEVMKKYVEGLDEVVTLVLKHAKQQKEQLVTFFVPKFNNRQPSSFIGLMRDACKAHLPPYMVPTHFIPLKALPLSANNKADAKQLAKIYDEYEVEELQKLSSTSETSRKWSENERKCAIVLGHTLGVDPEAFTSGTTIFELGVDSISVIGLSRALQKAGYANARLSVIMKNPSIGALVRVLVSEKAADNSPRFQVVEATQKIAAFSHKHKLSIADELKIESDEIEAVAPCTPSQEGMIYRFLDSPDNLYYNTFSFKLAEVVDVPKMKEAWKSLTQKLQILRTKFVLTSDGSAQVVMKLDAFKMSDVGENDKTEILANPWKVNFSSENGNQYMELTMLHTLYDGMSMPILLNKLQDEYLAKDDIDYGPDFYSVLPHGPLAIPSGAADFWKTLLDGYVFSQLPPNPKTVRNATVHTTRTLSKIDHIEAVRQSLGVTYQALLQAAWSSVFQNLTHSDVSFGLVISGRSIDFDDADKVIGPLLNTIVFRISINEGTSWKELIEMCHGFNVSVMPYQYTALKDVQKWCGSGSGQPLFDSLFVFQREAENENENLWTPVPSKPIADYPLAFEAQLNVDETLDLTIVGQSGYITPEMADLLLEDMEGALRALGNLNSLVPTLKGSEAIRSARKEQAEQPTSAEVQQDSTFSWSTETNLLREEIKSLAQVDDVAPTISLFELGLDSIDIIKLSSRLKKRGILLSVSSIIRHHNIAAMGETMAKTPVKTKNRMHLATYQAKLGDYLTKENKITADTDYVLPATPLQEGMMFGMIASDYATYFNHVAYRLEKDVDLSILKTSWKTVMEQHDILRTSFVEIQSENLPASYAQIVRKSAMDDWFTSETIVDVSIDSAIQAAVNQAITSARSKGQMFRLCAISGPRGKYFVLSIAHALYDGLSLQIMHDEVHRAYNQRSIGRPYPQDTLEELFQEDGSKAVKFWKAQLGDMPTSRFPSKGLQGDVVHRYQQQSRISITAINRRCREAGVTLQTLGQTCWALLLAAYQNELDVVFGAVLSCRDSEEANNIMFPFMNTVAIRAVLNGSLTDMLQYMQHKSNEIRQYQHFPLRKAQSVAGTTGKALFDTLFIYQGGPTKKEHMEPLYKEVWSASNVEYPVCVEVELVENEWMWRTACEESARSFEETKSMIADLETILKTIVERPDTPTIDNTVEGISICSLRRFSVHQVSSVHREKAVNYATSAVNWGDSELALASILRRVLAQVSKVTEEEIRNDTSIFQLGLDSISAIKVSSVLRKEDIKLTVQEILRNNSIETMVEHLSATHRDPNAHSQQETHTNNTGKIIDFDLIKAELGYAADEVQTVLPVSAGQEYMLARWQGSSGTAFTSTFEYQFRGMEGRPALVRAWRELVEHHALLRTAFVEIKLGRSDFVQVILKKKDTYTVRPSTVKVTLVNPVTLQIYRSQDGKQTLKLSIHHALYDAVSLPLLIRDLEKLVCQQALSKPTFDFLDYIAEQSEGFGTSLEHRKDFWRSYLGPRNQRKETSLGPESIRRELFMPNQDVGNLTRLARNRGVTVETLILAALSKCLRLFSQVAQNNNLKSLENIDIGLYLSNRAQYPDLAGPTLNLLPIRIPDQHVNSLCPIILKDIHRISDPSIVITGLNEIYEWTGTQIEIFANIWKAVPGDKEDVQGKGKAPERDALLSNDAQQAKIRKWRSGTVNLDHDHSIQATEAVRKIYLPSMDFEFRLAEDGTLDIGVFAPLNMIDHADMKKLVGLLTEGLRAWENQPPEIDPFESQKWPADAEEHDHEY